MVKIIFINNFSNYDIDQPVYYVGTDGFFLFGMGKFIAREIQKRENDFKFEIWRTDLRIDAVMEKEIEGFFCRIFPSHKSWIFEISPEIIKAFRQESLSEKTVFHFMGAHNINYHLWARIIKKNRIICTHLGGANPYWKYRHSMNARNLVFYLLEKYFFLKPYDVFISPCKTEVDYFRIVEKQVFQIPMFGFYGNEDLDLKDRNEAKSELGIITEKKIILQIGRATTARGFDWIMELLDDEALKNEYHFLFAGIDKEDKYYGDLIVRGYDPISYATHKTLNLYFNAADVLIYLPHGELDLTFAGTSYVPLEALYCGTPVVATTFIHFPGESKNLVSRTPKNKEDVIPMIRDLLSTEVDRTLCRKIMMDEYSWDKVLPLYMKIYRGEI